MEEIKKQLFMQPISGQPSGLSRHKKTKKLKIITKLLGIIGAIVLGVAISTVIWFNVQLKPLVSQAKENIKVTIIYGSTPAYIGEQLQRQLVIRSAKAFEVYTRLTNNNNKLQAGTYSLSPADSTQTIVTNLTAGAVDQFSITFYPGSTISDNTDKLASKKYDITTMLKKSGYSDQEIASALNKTYDSPLFADKPAGTSLEGYIYGETYNFNTGTSVEEILQRTFDEFYSKIKANNFIEKFKSRGLNLYQGITLASIIQKEVNSSADQKQVAQVFYLRYNQGEKLGSDVTYQYIADKTGVPRDTELDSPYNTRRYAGLPPGPISTPGLSALEAIANPATGDYVYFLSGDDDVTYFARTNAEHENNIVKYCKEKCATP